VAGELGCLTVVASPPLQILTCGSNFKIAYWDAYDGTCIRVVDGGTAAMTALDIPPDGKVFASGGADKVRANNVAETSHKEMLRCWHDEEEDEAVPGARHGDAEMCGR
jgi:WD40 repeat protein